MASSSNMDEFFQDGSTQSFGSAFFVTSNSSFPEQIAEVVTVLSRSTSDAEKFNAQAEAAEDAAAKSVLLSEILESLKGVKIEATDREFEAFVNLTLSLIFEHLSAGLESAVSQLADAILYTNNKTVSPTLSARYSSLCTLLNTVPPTVSGETRLAVVVKLVLAATGNDDFIIVSPIVDALDARLNEWHFGLGQEKEAEGNAALAQVVAALEAGGRPKAAYALLQTHFAGLESAPEFPASADRSSLALSYTLLALQLNAPFDYRILSRVATLAAAAGPEAAALAALVTSGDAAAAAAFSAEYAAFLSARGLSAATLEHKMKLIALAELCSAHVGEHVPYATLAAALAVDATDEEEIESYVIDAQRLTLVSGKISQTAQSLYVANAPPRTFTPAHWAQLLAQLRKWRASLDSIVSTVNVGLSGDPSAAGLLGQQLEEPVSEESIAV